MNKKTQVVDLSQMGIKVVGEVKETLEYLEKRGSVHPDKSSYPEFKHFALRLKQRYGIVISEKQYKNLLKKEVMYLSAVKHSNTRKVGVMCIQDKVVMVVKDTIGEGKLITALPLRPIY